MFNLVMLATSVTLFFAVMMRGPEFGFGVFVGGFLVAMLFWLWGQYPPRRAERRPTGTPYAEPQHGNQHRTGPFKQPPGQASHHHSAKQDYRERTIYKQLVLACSGDRAKADRLIAFEMSRDRNLTPASATVEALDRLRRDRAGGWTT